jgi:benzoyl-CoA reductase/2-hydroxyglutaryl-CoA dehydratase subunit BcrC/BadD/HgdB
VANGVRLLLIGNVLPDPSAHELLASCGAQIVDEDVCTGTRQLPAFTIDPGHPPLPQIAEQLLSRTPCARTVEPSRPGALAAQVAARARATGARGVIAHTLKFCDPYLVRLPSVRAALSEIGVPLLAIEGDCTLRSIGQQRTRIEAFVEMLKGADR